MADLTLYTHPQSRGRIARWMLEETGAAYSTEVIDYGPAMKGKYRSINPMGKVPAIRHGETIVTEAAAICAYLADAFPENRLAPPIDSPLRGTYYRWLFFAAGPLEQAGAVRSMGWNVPPDKEVQVGFGSYEAVMDTLEQAVSGDGYIVGDTFTAADVYVGSHIMWGMMFGLIEKRPAFERYCARLAPRPAHVRATEIDDKLTPQHRVSET